MRQRRDAKLEWLAAGLAALQLDPRVLRELASLGDRLDLPPGREIMRHGQRGVEAAVVVDGEVEVRRGGRAVARRGPGELVGELSIIDGQVRNADVVTVSDVQLLILHPSTLRAWMYDSGSLHDYACAAASRHRAADPPLAA